MNELLLSSATVIILFMLIANWRFAVVSAVIVAVIGYTIGIQTALIIFVGYGSLLLVIEAGTALIIGLVLTGLYSLVGLEYTIIIISLTITILSMLIFIALSEGQTSRSTAIRDFGTILLAGLLSGVSTFVSRIEAVGTIPSSRQFFKRGFSYFPGENFTKETREDFVNRGAQYIQEDALNVQKSKEKLVQDIQVAHNNSGQFLSDGESNIALALAVISFIPFITENVIRSFWFTSPEWVGAVLSVAILTAVSLRHATLDVVLYHDVTANEDQEKLVMMSEWNQYLSNGAKVLRAITLFRAIKAISTTAYDHYLDWVLEESIKRDGVDSMGLLSQWRELMCFVTADRRDISPAEASKQLFSENIFEDSVKKPT